MKMLLRIIPLLALTFTTSCKDKPSSDNPSGDAPKTAKEAAENFEENPEAAANKMAEIQENLADVMESIKDKESGEAALAKLEPIVAEFKAFGKVMEGKDKDITPELEAKLEGIVATSQGRIQEAMTKAMPILMSDPELAQKFQAVMAKMAE